MPYEKARTEQLGAVANELGLEFHPEGNPAVHRALGHLRLFNQGHGRKTKNMLCGQKEGVELAIFG